MECEICSDTDDQLNKNILKGLATSCLKHEYTGSIRYHESLTTEGKAYKPTHTGSITSMMTFPAKFCEFGVFFNMLLLF